MFIICKISKIKYNRKIPINFTEFFLHNKGAYYVKSRN